MTSFFDTTPQALSIWAMLGGGLLAFASPCVLPMLPVYAMYLMGGNEDTGRGWAPVLRRCLGLLCGFMLLFTILGASAGALGSLLTQADRGVLNIASAVLMIFFGLWMLDLFHGKSIPMPAWLSQHQLHMNGFFGSLLFGVVLALSWAPCISPVLLNALTLVAAADGATAWTGIVSLSVFALGLCLPMLLVMLLYRWLKGMLGWVRSHQHTIRRIGGVLMVGYGLYLIWVALA